MPSFDIVSKADIQKLDNAINTAIKEISTRYDFNGSHTEVELDKKLLRIVIMTENEMRLDAIRGILISRVMKQGLEPNFLDFGKIHAAAGNMLRKEVSIVNGIDKEIAKKIVKVIKDSGLKVQASIMEDQVRVTGKKTDDLQKAISIVRSAAFEQPLQYLNFRD
jgi:cyclic-di-GMP-binding protein